MRGFQIHQQVAHALVATLTPTERRVAELVCEGHGASEIARRMRLSVKTVDHHLTRIRKKLGVEETYGIPRIIYAANIEAQIAAS